MIIGVDCGCLGVSDNRLKVGVYRMAKALLQSLSRIDKKNFYHLYSFFPIEKNQLLRLGPRFKNVVVKPQKGWFNLWLPLFLQKNPVDVFIGLSQSLPRLPNKTKGIVFIHDLTFEKYSQWFPSYQKMSANSQNAVKKADSIIAVSEATKKDLVDIYHVPASKISTIYEGYDGRLKKLSFDKAIKRLTKLNIRKPYFLFAGTFKQSKNIPNIIRAFSLFAKEKPDYQLILVGSNYWLDKEISSTVKELNLGNSLRVLNFVGDETLAALYTKAEIFISPSFNEGFGLTYLEAANFNIPIICSSYGSPKEVLGKGAIFTDPKSPEDIAQAMKKLLKNNKLKNTIVKKALQNIKKFSWDKSAQKLLDILKGYEKK